METRYLFPHRFKKLGWCILLPSLVVGLLLLNEIVYFPWLDVEVFALYNPKMSGGQNGSFSLTENNLADELISVLLLVGTLLVACSRVRDEDEYIGKLRLESLLWATYVNAALLIFCLLFVYGIAFYQIMVFNLFTLMLLFLIRFHLVLYQTSKVPAYEE